MEVLMASYCYHLQRRLSVLATILWCIIACLSCDSDSTTGPNNGDTDPEDLISGHVLLMPFNLDLYQELSTEVSYGDTSFTVTCDDKGYFSFPSPTTDQEITITPVLLDNNRIFMPSSTTFTGKPENDILFFEVIAEFAMPQIVGVVSDENGLPIVNTPIDMITSQNSQTLKTQQNGVFHYCLSGSDSSTVAPQTNSLFTYEPEHYTFTNLSPGDKKVCIFTAKPATDLFSIHLSLDTHDANSIVVTIDGEIRYFYNRNHSLSLDHLLPGEHTIALSKFEPLTVTITDCDVYLSKSDFTYMGATEYTVTGCVITENGGDIEIVDILYYLFKEYHAPEITITETTQTGEYEFSCISGNEADVEYRIIPQHEGYTFEPDTLAVVIPYVHGTKDGGIIQVPDIIVTDHTVYHPDSFFPLNEGNQWTYSVTGTAEYTITIDGTDTAGSFTYSRFNPTGPGGMKLLRADGGDIHAWDGDEDIVLLRFGIVPGTEWESGTDSAGYKRTGVFYGLEDVTVPAGTYLDCLHYESRLTYGKTSYESHEMWFAEDVGLVRQVRTLVNYGDEIERTEMELISFGEQ